MELGQTHDTALKDHIHNGTSTSAYVIINMSQSSEIQRGTFKLNLTRRRRGVGLLHETVAHVCANISKRFHFTFWKFVKSNLQSVTGHYSIL